MVPLQGWLSLVLVLACVPLCATKGGCFSLDAMVSMADGTEKQLRHVRLGDEVASWDESSRRVAKSVVHALPNFQRAATELVEVMLPSAAFIATDDHPFWSRSKRSLVSIKPHLTMKEYGLHAEAFGNGEELEGHHNGTLHGIAAAWQRAPLAQLRGRRLMSNSSFVEVATLCAQHWFFVHGVRVHNKGGCFVKTAEVSMASGLKRQLQHVRVGDEVVSWDSTHQRVAKSTVVVAPTYFREASDMVEIRLPNARLHVTEDHPFWSSGKGGLVSAQPNRTAEEYSLHAEVLEAGELLEGEQLEAIRVSDVLRPPQSASLRRLAGTTSGLGSVEVMTLCLHPFPWFYVHGVRVHNKGCFAPWVRVLLSNGSHVPISSVRAEDHVASWDMAKGAPAADRVLAVETFPARQLIELRFNSSSAERRLGQSLGLVLTTDHPVYSSRWGAAVSLKPEETLAAYGLQVGQLQQRELLWHHQGHDVEAQVQPWVGDPPAAVMTLRLERHHWFYAEGVLVHNKGSYGGVGGGSDNPVLYFLTLSPAIGLLVWVHCCRSGAADREKKRRETTEGVNGHGLASVVWEGYYKEPCRGSCGTTSKAGYRWTFHENGQFDGSGTDNDGVASVTGVMVWPAEADAGEVRWLESLGPGHSIEVRGSISFEQGKRLGAEEAPVLRLSASYVAENFMHDGYIQLQSTQVFPLSSNEVQPQEEAPQAAPLMQGMGEMQPLVNP